MVELKKSNEIKKDSAELEFGNNLIVTLRIFLQKPIKIKIRCNEYTPKFSVEQLEFELSRYIPSYKAYLKLEGCFYKQFIYKKNKNSKVIYIEKKDKQKLIIDRGHLFIQLLPMGSSRAGKVVTSTLGGASHGATIGLVVGSIVPGIGHAVGAIVGGAVGALAGFAYSMWQTGVEARQKQIDQLALDRIRQVRELTRVQPKNITPFKKLQSKELSVELSDNRIDGGSPVPELFGQMRMKGRALTPVYLASLIESPGLKKYNYSSFYSFGEGPIEFSEHRFKTLHSRALRKFLRFYESQIPVITEYDGSVDNQMINIPGQNFDLEDFEFAPTFPDQDRAGVSVSLEFEENQVQNGQSRLSFNAVITKRNINESFSKDSLFTRDKDLWFLGYYDYEIDASGDPVTYSSRQSAQDRAVALGHSLPFAQSYQLANGSFLACWPRVNSSLPCFIVATGYENNDAEPNNLPSGVQVINGLPADLFPRYESFFLSAQQIEGATNFVQIKIPIISNPFVNNVRAIKAYRVSVTDLTTPGTQYVLRENFVNIQTAAIPSRFPVLTFDDAYGWSRVPGYSLGSIDDGSLLDSNILGFTRDHVLTTDFIKQRPESLEIDGTIYPVSQSGGYGRQTLNGNVIRRYSFALVEGVPKPPSGAWRNVRVNFANGSKSPAAEYVPSGQRPSQSKAQYVDITPGGVPPGGWGSRSWSRLSGTGNSHGAIDNASIMDPGILGITDQFIIVEDGFSKVPAAVEIDGSSFAVGPSKTDWDQAGFGAVDYYTITDRLPLSGNWDDLRIRFSDGTFSPDVIKGTGSIQINLDALVPLNTSRFNPMIKGADYFLTSNPEAVLRPKQEGFVVVEKSFVVRNPPSLPDYPEPPGVPPAAASPPSSDYQGISINRSTIYVPSISYINKLRTHQSSVEAYNSRITRIENNYKNLVQLWREEAEPFAEVFNKYREGSQNFSSFVKRKIQDLLDPVNTIPYSFQDNPAKIFVFILQKFIQRQEFNITLNDLIEISEFRKWRDFCDENELKFNGIIDFETRVSEILRTLAFVGMAEIDFSFGKMRPIISKARTNIMQYFHTRNLSELQYVRIKERIPHVILGEFLNEEKNYRIDQVKLFIGNHNEASAVDEEKISLFGVTNKAQALKYLTMQRKQYEFLNESWTFKTDIMSVAAQRGDLVGLNHFEISKAQFTCRIKGILKDENGMISGFQIDQENVPDLILGINYACRILYDDNTFIDIEIKDFQDKKLSTEQDQLAETDNTLIRTRQGNETIGARPKKFKSMIFKHLQDPDIFKGMKDNYVIFGETSSVFRECLVSSMTIQDDLSVNIVLTPYNSALYE